MKRVHLIKSLLSASKRNDGLLVMGISRAASTKAKTKPTDSFVMNMFRGKIETAQVFPFPETLSKDETDLIREMIDPVNSFMEEVNDPMKNDELEKVEPKTLDGLRELGAFGLQVPVDHGGVGLNNTQYARMVEIVGAHDLGVGITLGAHQSIGFKAILLYGNEAQKKKYLPDLASGKIMAAYCLTEPTSGSDASSIQTKAVKSADGSHYVLNGGKIWISNGGLADVFTVFAKTQSPDLDREKISAFIVERGFGGVSSGPPEKKMGIKCSNTASVYFEDVKVPAENLIGMEGDGFKVAMNVLNNGRFGMGAALGGTMRAAIAQAVQHATQRRQFGGLISSYGSVQEKIALMAMKHYANESMCYMISSNMDRGFTDFQLEAAISKIYGSESAWFCVDEAIQVLGGMGYMKDSGIERVMRDLRIFRIFEGANDILRLFVALTGMQYAAADVEKLGQAVKNPLSNPSLLMEFAGSRARRSLGFAGQPFGEAHSRLQASSLKMVQCIEGFGSTIQDLLIKHRKDIINQQFVLKRVADAAIDIYGMSAVLSRATLSLNRGSTSAEHEAQLCELFCNLAHSNAQSSLRSSLGGQKNFKLMSNISESICQHGGLLQEHVLGF